MEPAIATRNASADDDFEHDEYEDEDEERITKRKRASTVYDDGEEDMSFTKSRERPVKKTRLPKQPKQPKALRGVTIGVCKLPIPFHCMCMHPVKVFQWLSLFALHFLLSSWKSILHLL